MENEIQLFPRPTDARICRLIRVKNSFIIQSQFNNKTQQYDGELIISDDEPIAEWKAFNAYIGTFAEAVYKQLFKRNEYKDFIKNCREKVTGDED